MQRVKVAAEPLKEVLRSLHSMTNNVEMDDAHNLVHELIRLVFGTGNDGNDHVIIGLDRYGLDYEGVEDA